MDLGYQFDCFIFDYKLYFINKDFNGFIRKYEFIFNLLVYIFLKLINFVFYSIEFECLSDFFNVESLYILLNQFFKYIFRKQLFVFIMVSLLGQLLNLRLK